MIKDVMKNDDNNTIEQIVNKLNDKHPEYFTKKALYYNNVKKALAQMRAEVGRSIIQNFKDFNINKNGPCNKYSIKRKLLTGKKSKIKTLKKHIIYI